MRIDEITKEEFLDTLKDPRKGEALAYLDKMYNDFVDHGFNKISLEKDIDDSDDSNLGYVIKAQYKDLDVDYHEYDKIRTDVIRNVLQKHLPKYIPWDARNKDNRTIEVYF